ncbi:hypothetical protein HELRODRAFT_121825, partial [Helobdella robusta]|uniref:Carbonic anhydrase 1 n=1 Tax=Helobdella robusta TaxID=6412 RepID=T1EGS8_HELRO
GPDTWWVYYPSASGGNQSPIDIQTEDVHTNHELTAHPLQINYQTSGAGNKDGGTSGGTAGSGSSSSITGGPLKEYNYVLSRIELHWGESDNNGSEHLVNSRPFSAEVQLIHWNEDLYDSYDEACKRDDGIAIIAVFAKLSDNEGNKTLQTWSKIIEDVEYRGKCMHVKEEFDVKALLPGLYFYDTAKYWCYRGSYTTPPCYETVTWVVMSQTINITSNILKQFRGLRSYYDTDVRPDDEYDGLIQKNCRPVQPLGTRKI